MLSPQRAVAAASGGAGEAPDFPRARSMATPAALPAIARKRSPARRASLSWGSDREFGIGGCSLRPVGESVAGSAFLGPPIGSGRLPGSDPAPRGGR